MFHKSAFAPSGIMVREFANGPQDWSLIPSRVIWKTQKCYLMPPCLTYSIIRNRSRVNVASRKESSALYDSELSQLLKGSLRLAFNYDKSIYICTRIILSIWWILLKKIAIGNTVYSCNFSKEINSVSMTFFIDSCARKFSFTEESVHFHAIDCLFDSGSLW